MDCFLISVCLLCIICVLLLTFFIGAMYYRDYLLFWSSTTHNRNIVDWEGIQSVRLSYETKDTDQILEGFKYIPLTPNNAVSNTIENSHAFHESILIVIQGVGGNKTYCHDMIRKLQIIFPTKTIYIFDHPGHGATKGCKTLVSCIDAVTATMTWASKFRDVIWIGHCFGTVLIAKSIEKLNSTLVNKKKYNILILNGFMDPYEYGVRPLPTWIYQYLLCPFVPNFIKRELQCRHIYEMLIRSGSNIKVFHSQNDKWVHIEHGRRLKEVVGASNYFECIQSNQHHHMTIDVNNSTTLNFIQSIRNGMNERRDE